MNVVPQRELIWLKSQKLVSVSLCPIANVKSGSTMLEAVSSFPPPFTTRFIISIKYFKIFILFSRWKT